MSIFDLLDTHTQNGNRACHLITSIITPITGLQPSVVFGQPFCSKKFWKIQFTPCFQENILFRVRKYFTQRPGNVGASLKIKRNFKHNFKCDFKRNFIRDCLQLIVNIIRIWLPNVFFLHSHTLFYILYGNPYLTGGLCETLMCNYKAAKNLGTYSQCTEKVFFIKQWAYTKELNYIF